MTCTIYILTPPVRLRLFENDVKMYGTQASGNSIPVSPKFENDVKMYGTQACIPAEHCL